LTQSSERTGESKTPPPVATESLRIVVSELLLAAVSRILHQRAEPSDLLFISREASSRIGQSYLNSGKVNTALLMVALRVVPVAAPTYVLLLAFMAASSASPAAPSTRSILLVTDDNNRTSSVTRSGISLLMKSAAMTRSWARSFSVQPDRVHLQIHQWNAPDCSA